MGFITEEKAWFSPLQAMRRGKEPAVEREWLPFDMADAMENGFACELSTRFESPQGEEVREMAVCASEDNSQHVLVGKHDRPVLIARPCGTSKKDKSFDIFVAGEGQPPVALGPAFRLVHLKGSSTWELRGACCAGCEYRCPAGKRPALHEASRTLLRIKQERVSVGPGQCMSIVVAMPEQGDTWCSKCSASCGGHAADASKAQRFATRRPKWSARLKSLTLEFKGRCNQASEKNFQLTANMTGEGSHEDVLLSFGKMASGEFCLDFRGAFGPVQAFATALTTAHWH